MKSASKVFVSLTGGLGNQLFQLAAALGCSENSDITLLTSFGKPRKSNNNLADILEYSIGLPLESRRATWLIRKTAGYVLRMSALPRKYESNFFFEATARYVASIVLSIHLRKIVRIQSPKGVGFHQFQNISGNRVLLGYFQSFKWASQPEVKKRLLALDLHESNIEIDYFKKLSLVEKPLVVHVRRGDYLSEKSFGVLSQDYYKNAIHSQLALGTYKSIWLFSDDFDIAKKLIPKDLDLPVRLVREFDHSPALTLQVMRLGFGYVVANSSFSWWAAFLSQNHAANVIAPNPWFYALSEPEELIPPHWIRMKSSWEPLPG